MIRRAILAISFVIALAFLWPHAAKANQYPLCTHPNYLAYIDERLAPQTCEIIHSAPIVWRGGRSTIRAIRLTSAAPLTNIRQLSADIDAAAAGMGRAMDRLGGSLTLPPITVLFTDYVSPGTPRDNTFRKGAYEAAAVDVLDNDCPVGYYKNADATSSAYFTFILTHEVFHCAQYQNWPRMLDQQWLTEATAEYFAYLAQPDYGPGFIADFDSSTQSTPLSRMAYEAVPFWLWMSATDGPPAVRDIIPRVTADMSATITADRLIDFAEAYFDSTIKMPDGTTPMPSSPRIGGTHVVSGSEHIPAPNFTPYTLNERVIEFPAHKRFVLTYSPLASDQRMVWRKDSGGAWGPPLTEVVTCDGAQRFRMLYTSTSTAKFSDIDIRAENGGGAGVCTCPLGTWSETPESVKHYFEQTGFEAYAPSQIEYIGGGRTLRLNPDHTGSLSYDSVETIVRTSDPRIWLRQVKTGGTHFTWKVVGNMLLTVYTGGGNNLITLQNEQHAPNGVLNETRRGPPQSIGHVFFCDASGLHLRQPPRPALPAGFPATTFTTDMDFARGG
ncbi:hypothetical protein [Sphingomonas bacterium]|uniref:hypothetical protein n=1 Tax=Sphingomonas bacterium TaxID=1895847 RepID=UPI002621D732|nr:hypothetical protein [Sphingomonas bacterium]MDB5678751.1 hypothetical protein [Sphingomonas bacterium]